MAEKEIKMAKFVKVDGKPGRPLSDFTKEPSTFFPDPQKKGDISYDIYQAPVEFVKFIIAHKPDRYKLYDSPAIRTMVMGVNGSREWKTFYSWAIKSKQVQCFDENGNPDKDESTGEYKYKHIYEWAEQTPETFTQQAINQGIAKNAALKDKK